jgi:hypothetical protein
VLAAFGQLVQLYRQTRSYRRNARGECSDSCAVVRSNQVVAGAADPVQTIADVIHDCLQAPYIAVAVLPSNQIRNRGQMPHHCRAKDSPIAAVEQHTDFH